MGKHKKVSPINKSPKVTGKSKIQLNMPDTVSAQDGELGL